jgi:hypothetical protein
MIRWSLVLLALGTVAIAEVVTFEGNVLPEDAAAPWERIGTFDADRWIEDGWFHQYCDLGVWPGPRFGEDDWHQRWVTEFAGTDTFFVAWRVESNAPSEILDFFGTPTVLSAFGNTSAYYHFRFTDERVLVQRSTMLPLVYLDIEPGVAHTYYLELTTIDPGPRYMYAWYCDAVLIDGGVANGPYPTADSRLIWGARHDTYENHTRWDYVRYGIIPQPGSGDFDSSGLVDQTDLYMFQDCLLGPVPHGPGCSWADMNGDAITDGQDIGLFVDALLAGQPPPPPAGQEQAAPPRTAGPGVHSVNFDPRPGR